MRSKLFLLLASLLVFASSLTVIAAQPDIKSHGEIVVNNGVEVLIDSQDFYKLDAKFDENIAAFQSSINEEIDNFETTFNSKMEDLESRVYTDMASVRTQMTTEISEFKAHIADELIDFKDYVSSTVNADDSEFANEIEALRVDIDQRLSNLETTLTNRLNDFDKNIDKVIKDETTSLQNEVDALNESTNSRVSEHEAEVNTRLTQLNDHFTERADTADKAISDNKADLKKYIDDRDKEITDQLELIKKEVADGKAGIVSALMHDTSGEGLELSQEDLDLLQSYKENKDGVGDYSYEVLADAINSIRAKLSVEEYIDGFGGITVRGYFGVYDKKPHKSYVATTVVGATIRYDSDPNGAYTARDLPSYTNAGDYMDYYKIYDSTGEVMVSGRVRTVILKAQNVIELNETSTTVDWTNGTGTTTQKGTYSFQILSNWGDDEAEKTTITAVSSKPGTAAVAVCPSLTGTVKLNLDVPDSATITLTSKETNNIVETKVTFVINVTKIPGYCDLNNYGPYTMYTEDSYTLQIPRISTDYVLTCANNVTTDTSSVVATLGGKVVNTEENHESHSIAITALDIGQTTLHLNIPANPYYHEFNRDFVVNVIRRNSNLKWTNASDRSIYTEDSCTIPFTHSSNGALSITNTRQKDSYYTSDYEWELAQISGNNVIIQNLHDGQTTIKLSVAETHRYYKADISIKVTATKRASYCTRSVTSLAPYCRDTGTIRVTGCSGRLLEHYSSNSTDLSYTSSGSLSYNSTSMNSTGTLTINWTANLPGYKYIYFRLEENNRYYGDTYSITFNISKIPATLSCSTTIDVYVDATGTYNVTCDETDWYVSNSYSQYFTATKSGNKLTIAGIKNTSSSYKTMYLYTYGNSQIAVGSLAISVRINLNPGTCSTSISSATIMKTEYQTLAVSMHTGAYLSATSSNTYVATVSVSGSSVTITGVHEGTVTVTLTASSTYKYATATKYLTITIKGYAITINTDSSTYTLYIGYQQDRPLPIIKGPSGEVVNAFITVTKGSYYSSYVTEYRNYSNDSGYDWTGRSTGSTTLTFNVAETGKYASGSKTVNVVVKDRITPSLYFTDLPSTFEVGKLYTVHYYTNSTGAVSLSFNGAFSYYSDVKSTRSIIFETRQAGTGSINISIAADKEYKATSISTGYLNVTKQKAKIYVGVNSSALATSAELDYPIGTQFSFMVALNKDISASTISLNTTVNDSSIASISSKTTLSGSGSNSTYLKFTVTGKANKAGETNITISIPDDSVFTYDDATVTITVTKKPSTFSVTPTYQKYAGKSLVFTYSGAVGQVTVDTNTELYSITHNSSSKTVTIDPLAAGLLYINIYDSGNSEYESGEVQVTVEVTFAYGVSTYAKDDAALRPTSGHYKDSAKDDGYCEFTGLTIGNYYLLFHSDTGDSKTFGLGENKNNFANTNYFTTSGIEFIDISQVYHGDPWYNRNVYLIKATSTTIRIQFKAGRNYGDGNSTRGGFSKVHLYPLGKFKLDRSSVVTGFTKPDTGVSTDGNLTYKLTPNHYYVYFGQLVNNSFSDTLNKVTTNASSTITYAGHTASSTGISNRISGQILYVFLYTGSTVTTQLNDQTKPYGFMDLGVAYNSGIKMANASITITSSNNTGTTTEPQVCASYGSAFSGQLVFQLIAGYYHKQSKITNMELAYDYKFATKAWNTLLETEFYDNLFLCIYRLNSTSGSVYYDKTIKNKTFGVSYLMNIRPPVVYDSYTYKEDFKVFSSGQVVPKGSIGILLYGPTSYSFGASGSPYYKSAILTSIGQKGTFGDTTQRTYKDANENSIKALTRPMYAYAVCNLRSDFKLLSNSYFVNAYTEQITSSGTAPTFAGDDPSED